ncbi:dual specificity protein phosphatase family protein [Pyxidicoccus parkwayensis]|uniref:Dual specificity protein phosphatase family protein n=1 Tax=Pyxidicoccus parkwayensis TaxID=2813578 RepID=A0ABX7NUM0_9BACT|nr:protein-tyrosine phosphatase family protein [Pyxidicoccus parkwaysis]QSQ22074.1 dual specificity protein phosphatase family protein [Pyxidicoccus parkwaysis]
MLRRSFPLPLGKGRVAIVGRPRGGDWLEDELTALRAEGFDVLVSMLCPDEEEALELTREAETAARLGLEYVSLPVPDRGVPDVAQARPVLVRLARHVEDGGTVAVHCRMGIGRSCLFAASLLRLSGIPSEQAWRQVETARGCSVPDTPEQRAWIDSLVPRAR